MKARSLAYLLVTGLGLVAFGTSGYVCYQAFDRLRSVEQGRKLVDILKPSVKFVEALALERGAYNEALVNRVAPMPALWAKVATQRSLTDPLFADAIAAAMGLHGEFGKRVAGAISQARQEIWRAREDADRYLTPDSPAAPREATTLVQRYREAGADVDRALAATERELAALDPELGLKLELSRLSNDMREDAGLRSTLLSRYIAIGKPLDRAEREELLKLDGALLNTWGRLQRIAGDVGGVRVAEGIEHIRDTFFGEAAQTYHATIEAALDGAAPPMDLTAWRKWTVARLGETLAVRDTAVEEVAEALNTMQDSAIAAASKDLAGVLGLLIALTLIEAYLERRVLRPIAMLTRELERDQVRNSEPELDTALAAGLAERDDEIGALARALARLRDHSEDLRAANERFDALIDNLPHGVCFYDSKDFLIVANARFGELYGFPDVDALIGMKFNSIFELGAALNGGLTDSERERFDEEQATRRDVEGRIDDKVVALPNGRFIAINGRHVPGGGWISTHVDITEKRRAEQQIAFIAEHDSLTSLANRQLFDRRLATAVQRGERGMSYAVMCLDLDRFKIVNDQLGHGLGDELLRQAAQRMRNCVRAVDCVARVGGDEFAILLEDPRDRLAEIAERIIDRVAEPYDLDGQRAEIGVSVGIAIGKTDASTPHELLRAADLAMYRAKTDGRGAYRFFEPAMDEHVRMRRSLEHDMRTAVSHGELDLEYQPVFSLESNEIVAFEAPLRWNHPRRGRIAPADFITLAEDCGLIVDIGAWAIRRACEEAMRWPNGLKVAVNLSPRQFQGGRLLADIVGALAHSGIAPWRLELEVTERVMLANIEATLATLQELRGLGVPIALDDFGSGYSSLSFLRRFPFHRIKIDQTFVRDIDRDDSALAIIRTVNGLARALDMKTTAEGVETRRQFESLKAEGCDDVQGYFIGGPVLADEIPAILGKVAATALVA